MPGHGPTLVLPRSWTPTEIAPPPVRADSAVSVDVWDGWAAPEGGSGRALVGCYGFPLDTWADEMQSIAVDALRASLRSAALRLEPGLGLDVQGSEEGVALTGERFVRDGDTSGHVLARSFLGFVREPGRGEASGASKLEGCFALCAPTSDDCEQALAHAVPPLFVPPPPATTVVRVAVALVHHSRVVAISGVTLFLCLGVLAIVTRPRPRRK